MTNTARRAYKVEHHGSYCIVWTPWGPVTCMNQQALWNLICRDELPVVRNCKNVKISKETVEEYLARGGKIQKVGFPQAKKLTLHDLGLLDGLLNASTEPAEPFDDSAEEDIPPESEDLEALPEG